MSEEKVFTRQNMNARALVVTHTYPPEPPSLSARHALEMSSKRRFSVGISVLHDPIAQLECVRDRLGRLKHRADIDVPRVPLHLFGAVPGLEEERKKERKKERSRFDSIRAGVDTDLNTRLESQSTPGITLEPRIDIEHIRGKREKQQQT